MNINKTQGQAPAAPANKKLTKEQIKAKLSEKFGEKIRTQGPKKQKTEDSVEVKGKPTVDHTGLKTDIATNDPSSAETQEKLRSILKSGGFDFNQKERKALADILEVQ